MEFQPRSDAQCSFHVSLKWACVQDYVLCPHQFHISVGLIVCYWYFCGFLVSCMAVTRYRSVKQCCQLNYKFRATQPAYFKIILSYFPLHISLIYFAPRIYPLRIMTQVSKLLRTEHKVHLFFISHGLGAPSGSGPPLRLLGHIQTHHTSHTVGILWTSDRPVAETSTCQHTTLTTDGHPCHWRDFNPQSQQKSGRRPTR